MTELWLLLPLSALAAALLALGPLGVHVLRRGVVFIDLAIAQSAAAGALASLSLVDHPAWWVTQSAATLGAVFAAGAVALLARRWPAQREALIGLLYVSSATLALLCAHQDAHGGEHLRTLLAADVLWAEAPQVAALAACALAVTVLRRRLILDRWFYPVFAIVASIAVQTLGLFVVFATLITPGLWQQRGSGALPALGVAAAACLVGLSLSWAMDAASGPLVALILALAGILSALRTGMIDRDSALPSVQNSALLADRQPKPRHD